MLSSPRPSPLAVTYTPQPTPDIFATEMGLTAEEMLQYIAGIPVQPSDSQKEQILARFLRSRVADPDFNPAASWLDDYIDDIEVSVGEGEIVFYVYAEIPTQQKFYSLFEDLFFAGLVHATDENGRFKWTTDTIGVVFVDDDGTWFDMYMNRENIIAFLQSPDQLYELVDVQTSSD